MNLNLTTSIIKHIYSSLMIIPSDFIDYNKNKSIISKDFLLDKTLNISDETKVFNNKVWACQGNTSNKKLSLLGANCSIDNSIYEYALIISLEDAPAYGCYLVANEDYNSDALIACTLDGKNWMECTTYLQATFLAGMEQIKDSNISWSKLNDYDKEFDLLHSFLKFHDSIYGDQ